MHIHTNFLNILCGVDFENCNSTPNQDSKLVTCKECLEKHKHLIGALSTEKK